jgi:uncharacterized protein (TIGR03086 family)
MTPTTPTTDTTTRPSDAEIATVLRAYGRSLDVLEQAIRTADRDRWDDPSPCSAWTARQVAGHAMKFLTDLVELSGNGPDPDLHATGDLAARAGADPGLTWTATRREIEAELLTRPDRLAAVRMTPLGVEMPMIDLLPYQGMDPVVHGWDIAVATGGTADIPTDLAEHYRAQFAPVEATLRERGVLGPRTDPPADGAVGELLAFCGRVRP